MTLKQSGLKFTLADVKTVVHKWLYLEHDEVIDIIMGTYIANRLRTDPLWLVLIAPPSESKTELLRAFEGYCGAYFLSNLTPSTLVSGMLPKKKTTDPSLLLRLNDKTLILKDFTSILSMRSEHRQEILGQLREIYDGQYSKAFGNGKEINWKGQVGLMAACTPAYDRHYSTISSLGDRFVLYRTNTDDQEKMGLRAFMDVGKEETMRREISDAYHRFLRQFENLGKVDFKKDETVQDKIVNLACFCAIGRCGVERDKYKQTILYIPIPEGSPRLTKQFTQMGTGIALAQGKNTIDKNVYDIIKRIALSILPAHRRIVLEYLWKEEVFEHFRMWKKTKEIAEAVGLPKSTTKLLLEDLQVVGMLNKTLARDENTEEEKRTPYEWQFTETAHGYAIKSGIFEKKNEVPF